MWVFDQGKDVGTWQELTIDLHQTHLHTHTSSSHAAFYNLHVGVDAWRMVVCWALEYKSHQNTIGNTLDNIQMRDLHHIIASIDRWTKPIRQRDNTIIHETNCTKQANTLRHKTKNVDQIKTLHQMKKKHQTKQENTQPYKKTIQLTIQDNIWLNNQKH